MGGHSGSAPEDREIRIQAPQLAGRAFPRAAVAVGAGVFAVLVGVVLIVVGLIGSMPTPDRPGSATPTLGHPVTPAVAATAAPADLATATATDSPHAVADDMPPHGRRSAPVEPSPDAVAAGATILRLQRLDLTRYLGSVVKRGDPGAGMVALTFDDGPWRNTRTILRDLTATGSHATFFMIGNRLKGEPELGRAVLAQGSEIGNHTYTHVRMKKMSKSVFDAEVVRTQDVMFSLIGWRPRLVRPMSGSQDVGGVRMAAQAGLVVADWSDHSEDTMGDATVASILRNATFARSGAIILMHEKKKETVEALPAIIAALHKRGLKLVTVSELLDASK